MNVPKAIESAIITQLREYGVGDKTLIRSWRNLRIDPRWDKSKDRAFPCIDVRSSPPSMKDGNNSLEIDTQIIIYTSCADDKDHAMLNSIEEAVQECLDSMIAQHRAGTTGSAYSAFESEIEASCQGLSVGGIYFGEPTAPDEDGAGHYTVAISLITAYSRSDFR